MVDFNKIEYEFKQNKFRNEDDVKINFHTYIIAPLIREFNPNLVSQYRGEDRLVAGGRTDATFQNILFEFKKEKYFRKSKGIQEALYGRDDSDHGLYDYIISNSDVDDKDDCVSITKKLKSSIGVGFDGESFIFARFIPSISSNKIETRKTKIHINEPLQLDFSYEIKNFQQGLKRLVLLLKQREKMALNKKNILSIFNTKNPFVRESIFDIYQNIEYNLKNNQGSDRVRTLYGEWNRVFGVVYGEDDQATGFTEVSSKIKEAYGIKKNANIDSKAYLFALQTFFNIFLKLLIHSFLSQLTDPSFTTTQNLEKADIDRLFDGQEKRDSQLVGNFFEVHFLEWFTFTSNNFEEKIVNKILGLIDLFDLSSYVLKPENIQDILQEIYMELIPPEMRHLMGEYFSPDWIVEHALDIAGYNGDIDKTLIDPCSGSGPFISQALKRIIQKKKGTLSKQDILKITQNIVAFDINPISVVAAKANYILILFSAFFDNCGEGFGNAVNIPVFIADSILSPVVYAEENKETLKLRTSIGLLELPKFESFKKGSDFLALLSQFIHEKADYETFENCAIGKKLITKKDLIIVRNLFDKLYVLHRSGKDSFWPIILKNSFAPTMIGNKFDYVVGNPPWIAWKSMSKSYREGTLSIWHSYGIFEKNAYDKKTTHDDFGMAVTYVSIDQYLKNNGTMAFLLPASFLKSTKGGEGFRKLKIIRNNQDIPFSIDCVHDFSDVSLFTIPTVAIRFRKGQSMSYPMNNYVVFHQEGGKKAIDSHRDWNSVSNLLGSETLCAKPVDEDDIQSAWLTLKNLDFAISVLNRKTPRVYKGRKGIEPAGAKGVYVLKEPKKSELGDGYLKIENDINRQRREDIIKKGVHIGDVEEDYIYPMLGGRNISKWKVKSSEFMIVPHSIRNKYGVPEKVLAAVAPETYLWLRFYHDELLQSRIQNGKFFNQATNPFYRLDNIGDYTYAPYKVLWKEQTGSMSAVVVSTYYKSVPNANRNLFKRDKRIVVDSKVLMLGLDNEDEAYYVCGIINAPNVVEVIDGYAIPTNRGVDVLKYIAIPKYNQDNPIHKKIADISKEIHVLAKDGKKYGDKEKELTEIVYALFMKNSK